MKQVGWVGGQPIESDYPFQSFDADKLIQRSEGQRQMLSALLIYLNIARILEAFCVGSSSCYGHNLHSNGKTISNLRQLSLGMSAADIASLTDAKELIFPWIRA